MECQTKEDCTKKNPKSFCHMFMCVDCLKENVACTQNGQCCDGTECIYGRCKKGAKKDPGRLEFWFDNLQHKIVLSVLNCSPSWSVKDHLLLIQCYYRRKSNLN